MASRMIAITTVPLDVWKPANQDREVIIDFEKDSPDDNSNVLNANGFPAAYRNLTWEELKVGTKCQKRIFGEYDTEICCPAECLDHYNLTDELGWHWAEHELTMEDLDFLYGGTSTKYSPNGFFRIKLK
jgi:hypothetical protein